MLRHAHRFGVSLLLAIAVATTAVAGPAAASGSEPAKPVVAEAYQRYLDRAWQTAIEGRSPASRCAVLKGVAHGAMSSDDAVVRADAAQAVDACSVGVSARYLFTYLEQVEAGDRTCMDFMTQAASNISALVMGVNGESHEMATQRRRRLLDTIAPRVQELCPDAAPAIVGRR